MRIAFVDPSASSAYLGETLRQNKVESIAILTPRFSQVYPYFASRITPYEYDFSVRTDETVSHLKELKPDYIFYGFEFSIPEADQIVNEVLPTQVNDMKLTDARMNKFEMHQQLMNLNLPYAIPQIKMGHNDIQSFRQKISHLEFPLYAKPAISAITLGGKVCNSYEELEKTLLQHFKEEKRAGEEGSYLIQECVTGVEHCIDTVTLHGVHHIVGVCRYEKTRFFNCVVPHVYTIVDPSQSQDWKKIEDFIGKTLDALGYKNGLAHTEFFIREDGSIKLIEVNFRISGSYGYINKMFSLAYGKNAIEVLLHAISDTMPKTLKASGFAKKLNLQNWTLKDRPFHIHNVEKLKKIPSYKEHQIYRGDQKIVPSLANFTNIFDSPGQVLLFNQDLNQLNEDVRIIDDLFERQEIF